MKNLFLISVLSLLGVNAHAKFILVNNNVNALEKFKSLQVAYDSAAVGDTIYLVPSSTSYESITIKKRITLLGAGLKDKNANILTVFSKINGVIVDTSGTPFIKTSGTIISGIYIDGAPGNRVFIASNLKSVFIFNCFITTYGSPFYSLTPGDNNSQVFDNIIVGDVTLTNNVLFRNNIVTGVIRNGVNCNISNNIFLGTSPIVNFNASAFINNIFLSPTAAINNTSPGLNNSYANNVQGGSDLGSGNLRSTDMATVFQETIGTTSGTALIGLSFMIKAGSPALTAGTSGGEVGVYGGTYPWPKGVVYTRSPGVLPVMTSLVVQNQTVAPGGTIKFNFKAKSLK